MSWIDDLLALGREYARSTGLELSTVSWRVFGDNKKLPAIAAGADIQVRRYETAIEWFSANWPDNAVWPSHVERPAHHEEAAE